MEKHSFLFVNRPGHDFMRQYSGKLTFGDTMKLILSMGKSTVSNEIINYFDMDVDRIPTPSAFNQRRKQLSLFVFQYLFNEFSVSFPQVTHQLITCTSMVLLTLSQRLFSISGSSRYKSRMNVQHYMICWLILIRMFPKDISSPPIGDMNPNKNIPHFKPLLASRSAVYIRFRVLKIKTSDTTWEYIITNLPDSFDLDDIKECYHWPSL